MTNVVIVQKKSKLKWDFHRNAKPKGLPWINSKPKPNETIGLLWTSNDCINEIEWLPSGEPRLRRTCQENVR
jgi:hypothetical protein